VNTSMFAGVYRFMMNEGRSEGECYNNSSITEYLRVI